MSRFLNFGADPWKGQWALPYKPQKDVWVMMFQCWIYVEIGSQHQTI